MLWALRSSLCKYASRPALRVAFVANRNNVGRLCVITMVISPCYRAAIYALCHSVEFLNFSTADCFMNVGDGFASDPRSFKRTLKTTKATACMPIDLETLFAYRACLFCHESQSFGAITRIAQTVMSLRCVLTRTAFAFYGWSHITAPRMSGSRTRTNNVENLLARQNTGVFCFSALDLRQRVKRNGRLLGKRFNFFPRLAVQVSFNGVQDVHA